MSSQNKSDSNRSKFGKGFIDLSVVLFVGLICAFKKIIYPVAVPNNIIGVEYSRPSDILTAFFIGIVLTLFISSLITGIANLIIDEVIPKRHTTIDEYLEIESHKTSRSRHIFFIVCVLTAISMVSFTEFFDPRDFYKEMENSNYYDGMYYE
jgi:hypothetical protein